MSLNINDLKCLQFLAHLKINLKMNYTFDTLLISLNSNSNSFIRLNEYLAGTFDP